MLRVASRILRRLGYRVLEAADAEQALAILGERAAEVDLLLADIVLPGMGGRELAEQATALRPGIKTLFMSGYTVDVVLQHQLVEHPGELLQKPFTAEVLAQKTRAALDA